MRESNHPLPPLCRYSALFAASQPGNELQKFRINRERIGGKGRPGSRTRTRKGKKKKDSNKKCLGPRPGG
jgi:hypothetical protein